MEINLCNEKMLLRGEKSFLYKNCVWGVFGIKNLDLKGIFVVRRKF